MANLSITTVCNRNCVYCFANDIRSDYNDSFMEPSIYEEALDYLERSKLKQARLLGGEPTLHPEFIPFVQRALNRNLSIMLFSNGLMASSVLDYLSKLPGSKLSVLLNSVNPLEGNNKEVESQRNVMAALGDIVIPGVNIYRPAQKLDYLLDYVKKYNLKKEIRLGISHSVIGRNNSYLHPKDYYKVGNEIALFKQKAQKSGIKLGFDCGFVPCMFPSDSFDLLSGELEKAGSCCHPVIDILSDGAMISCYPLYHYKKVKMNSKLDVEAITSLFRKELNPYKDSGIFPHCNSCSLFNNRCNGGCISFRIQRYETITQTA